MPQFDPTYYASQVFWLLALFVCLFSYVRFVFMPRILSMLSKRHNAIERDVKEAQKIHSEITALIAQHEELLSTTKAQSSEHVLHTIETLRKQQDEAVSRLDAEIQENIREFQQSASRQHKQVVKDIQILVQKNIELAHERILPNQTIKSENSHA